MSTKLSSFLTVIARCSRLRTSSFLCTKGPLFANNTGRQNDGRRHHSGYGQENVRQGASYVVPIAAAVGACIGYALWERNKSHATVLCEVGVQSGRKDKLDHSKKLSLQEAVTQTELLLKQLMMEHSCPGLVITVTVDGKEVLSEGYGLADVENAVPCSPSTVMRIASISKPVTMAAVAKLWEEKKLDLDRPIQDYVPSWPEKYFNGEKVTITTRQLVSMLGGVRNYDTKCMDLESNKLKEKKKKKSKDDAAKEKYNKDKGEDKKKDKDKEKDKEDKEKRKNKDKEKDKEDKEKKKNKDKDKEKDKDDKEKKKNRDKDNEEDKEDKEKKKKKEKDKEDKEKKKNKDKDNEEDKEDKEKKKKKDKEKDKEDKEKKKNKDKDNEENKEDKEKKKKKDKEKDKDDKEKKKNKDKDKEKDKEDKEKKKNKDKDKEKDKEDKEKKKNKDKDKEKDKEDKEKKKSKDDPDHKEFYLKKHFSSVTESLNLFKDDDLCCLPGTEYLYSTHTWTLVSAAVEKAAGKLFPQVMKELFKELGLTNTYVDETSSIIYNRARYYVVNKKGQLINAPYVDTSYKWAGGGFASTSGDLCRFGNAMLYSFQAPSSSGASGFLRSDTMRMIWSPVPNTRCKWDSAGSYGMGWATIPPVEHPPFTREQRQYFSHTGGAIGASSVLLVLPRSELNTACGPEGLPLGVVVAIIVNMQSVGMNRLALDVAKMFEQVNVA